MAVKYIAAFLTLADPRNFTCVSSQPWSALIDLSVILTGSYSILDTPTKHSYKKRNNRQERQFRRSSLQRDTRFIYIIDSTQKHIMFEKAYLQHYNRKNIFKIYINMCKIIPLNP